MKTLRIGVQIRLQPLHLGGQAHLLGKHVAPEAAAVDHRGTDLLAHEKQHRKRDADTRRGDQAVAHRDRNDRGDDRGDAVGRTGLGRKTEQDRPRRRGLAQKPHDHLGDDAQQSLGPDKETVQFKAGLVLVTATARAYDGAVGHHDLGVHPALGERRRRGDPIVQGFCSWSNTTQCLLY